VRVMRLLDLRGVRAARIFLGGATEGALPGPPAPALLLGDADRERLGLSTHDDAVAELRHLFAIAVAAPTGGLEISIPRGGRDADVAASGCVQALSRPGKTEIGGGDAPPRPAACHTEERRQRLLAQADAPALSRAGLAPPAAILAAIRAERAREASAPGAW